MPLGADNFAEAGSNEYGGPVLGRGREHHCSSAHGDTSASLEAWSSPREGIQNFFARRLQVEHEGVLVASTEAGRRPGDIDRVVRRDRDSLSRFTDPTGKLPIEDERAV